MVHVEGASVKHVLLSEIDLADTFYCRSYPRSVPESLKRSLQQIGLVHPVFLGLRRNGTMRVVHGHRRCWAAAELGFKSVPAIVVDEAELSPKLLYLWSLWQDVGHRRYNRAELSLILNRLSNEWNTPEEELLRILQELSGCGGEPQLRRLLRLSRAEPAVLDLVASGDLPDDVLDVILNWSPADRTAYASLVAQLRLSVSSQRELTRLLDDLARREKSSPSELLRREEIASVVEHPRWTSTQKAQRILSKLREWRYPTLASLEAEFEQTRRKLKLPPRSELRHAPFFETSEIWLTLRFQRPEELQRAAEDLIRIAGSEELGRLFDVLVA